MRLATLEIIELLTPPPQPSGVGQTVLVRPYRRWLVLCGKKPALARPTLLPPSAAGGALGKAQPLCR